VGGAQSDLDALLRRADSWDLSRGRAIDRSGFRRFGSRGHGITVSARLSFFGNGTLVVRYDLSWCAWPRSGTSCW